MFSFLLLCGQMASSSDAPAATIPPIEPQIQGIVDRAITILYDNNRFDPRLKAQWGFSCLVEGWEKTILFDTGGDGSVLLHNVRQLGIRPGWVDALVLSHIHGDHTGGVKAVLVEKSDVDVYLPRSFPESFKGTVKSLGANVEEVSGARQICTDVFTTGELGKGIVEQSLVLRTPEGLVVITGCAHPGVVQVVRAAKEMSGEDKVCLVLGGFHLAGEPISRIKSVLQAFRRLSVRNVAPCHCSGDQTRRLFEEEYGERYIESGVGKRIKLGELDPE